MRERSHNSCTPRKRMGAKLPYDGRQRWNHPARNFLRPGVTTHTKIINKEARVVGTVTW